MTMHAAILLAAIVTDQLGVFLKVPAWVPTRVDPCCIPYGTYTDGQGDVEYTRATSNLTACLVSTIDGYLERDLAIDRFTQPMYTVNEGASPVTMEGRDFYRAGDCRRAALCDTPFLRWPEAFVPDTATTGIPEASLIGNYPEPWQMALSSFLFGDWSYSPLGNVATNATTTRLMTMHLAKTEENLCSGAATKYGIVCKYSSKYLRELAGDSSPLPSSWAPIEESAPRSYPFNQYNAEGWVRTWPTYEAVGADWIFFKTNGVPVEQRRNIQYLRPHIVSLAQEMSALFGNDYVSQAEECFKEMAEMPNQDDFGNPVTMEQVLGRDPGWNSIRDADRDEWIVNGIKLHPKPRQQVGILEWESTNTVAIGSHSNVTMLVKIDGISGTNTLTLTSAGTVLDEFAKAGHPGDPYEDTHFDFVYEGRHLVGTRILSLSNNEMYHWRNGTSRLDWQRLGVVAQMERQMERTYHMEPSDDHYTRLNETTTGVRPYVNSNAVVSVRYAANPSDPFACIVTMESPGEWNAESNAVVTAVTNFSIEAFSTAYSSTPHLSASIGADFSHATTYYITTAMVSNIMDRVFADFWQQTYGGIDLGTEIDAEIFASVYVSYTTDGLPIVWLRGEEAGLMAESGYYSVYPIERPEVGPVPWPIFGEGLGTIISQGQYTNMTAVLRANIAKSVDARWTAVDDSAIYYPSFDKWVSDNLFTKPYPNYIKSCGYQTYEGIVAVSNAAARLRADTMLTWHTNDTDYVVRKYRGTADIDGIVTSNGLSSARAGSMRSLNNGVLSTFYDISGVDVRSAGALYASDITLADCGKCVRNLSFKSTQADIVRHAAYKIKVRVPIDRYGPEWAYFVAGDVTVSGFDCTDDMSETPFWAKEWYPLPPYFPGLDPTLGWVPFYVTVIPPEVECDEPEQPTSPTSIRVDGAGPHMFWTDWNFKNLKESTQP